jgi:hypothetical protein
VIEKDEPTPKLFLHGLSSGINLNTNQWNKLLSFETQIINFANYQGDKELYLDLSTATNTTTLEGRDSGALRMISITQKTFENDETTCICITQPTVQIIFDHKQLVSNYFYKINSNFEEIKKFLKELEPGAQPHLRPCFDFKEFADELLLPVLY